MSGVWHRAVPADPLFWSLNLAVPENTGTATLPLWPIIVEVTNFLA